MEIANDINNRIVLKEGKQRRRQLMLLFYKYIREDVTIIPTHEFEALVDKYMPNQGEGENKVLESQVKMMNAMAQAEKDRLDIHRDNRPLSVPGKREN